jgi:phosphinothricin acetyltransferase
MTRVVRFATDADAPGVQAIYAPFVRDTAVSFEVEPPTVAEMGGRITTTLARWPWLVCADGGAVAGYAYASAHRDRAAYQWSADVTVYVAPSHHRRGVGRACYTALLRIVRLQGFHTAYAGITLPNAGSVGLHETLGFTPVAVYREVGFKLGAWRDVGWWRLALAPPVPEPPPPRAFADVRGDADVAAAVAAGSALLAGPATPRA